MALQEQLAVGVLVPYLPLREQLVVGGGFADPVLGWAPLPCVACRGQLAVGDGDTGRVPGSVQALQVQLAVEGRNLDQVQGNLPLPCQVPWLQLAVGGRNFEHAPG